MAILIILVLILYFGIKNWRYRKTEYYQQTHISFVKAMYDKGTIGEYRTYIQLRNVPGNRKFLFNIYVPKENGETTELDVVMIHETGIYVFESKNYSGWIFGTETQKNWTQTLPVGKGKSQKSYFLNPIIQNKVHIKWLRKFLGDEGVPFYSFIVFSERCTLKEINLTSGEHFVVKRNALFRMVDEKIKNSTRIYDSEQIENLYNNLSKLTNVDPEIKSAHIQNIQEKYKAVSQVNHQQSPMEPVNEDDENKTSLKCPLCGGTLVLRTATRGTNKGNMFYGCSNYPKCHYIKNVDSSPAENNVVDEQKGKD